MLGPTHNKVYNVIINLQFYYEKGGTQTSGMEFVSFWMGRAISYDIDGIKIEDQVWDLLLILLEPITHYRIVRDNL